MAAALTTLRWGRRQDGLLVAWEQVNRRVLERLECRQALQHTGSFAVLRRPGTTLVVHRLPRGEVDNDIGALIADELVRTGLVAGAHAFERCFAGVVESTGPSPRVSWRRFYRNTLRALSRPPRTGDAAGPIASFREIYRHAERLVAGGGVLDVGSCFGFFPLLLAARRGLRVTASDCEPRTVELGARMASDFGLPVRFRVADVTRRLPFAPARFDTVTALHLIEHLPAAVTPGVIDRLTRAARRRVVVAVPLEHTPDPAFGHLQCYDLERLLALARSLTGWSAEVHERHGGWLVLDRRARRRNAHDTPGPGSSAHA
jgi:SAM-dependent methyltransferase